MEISILKNIKPSYVVAENDQLQVSYEQTDNVYKMTVKNKTNHDVKIKEVVCFSGELISNENIWFYGEGYNMLSQYTGTIKEPYCITGYTDKKHYKLPQKDGMFTVYNMIILKNEDKYYLFAFSSCNKFGGEFRFNDNYLQCVIDYENLTLKSGEVQILEELMILEGNDKNELIDTLAKRINHNHKPLKFKQPTGWCSWYCFGADINKENIIDNSDVMLDKLKELEYVQIDDGYQSAMGDWLIPKEGFEPDVKTLCNLISSKGLLPAIWVAPFIAEENSVLFKEHPEYFVKGDDGKPLKSSEVTFGGWRNGPWYMLDGTHPGAREYLKNVFKTMRNEWGCTYFKLDANVWGAFSFGKRYDETATKTQAYRMAMEAIIEGAGKDSFILGCNAPMWQSIGVVHGMRITGDIQRTWEIFKTLSFECFYRNWQHNNLWINDADCIVLENLNLEQIAVDGTIKRTETNITKDEFSYHIAHIIASGGMVLSGDDLTKMNTDNIELLKRIISVSGNAAKFDDESFSIARINKEFILVFNSTDESKTINVDIGGNYELIDFLTKENLGTLSAITLNLNPHSAKILNLK